MNRKKIILKHIRPDGYGIEIGPSHSPVASKRDGYKVEIIDHMSREQLIEKYQEHSVSVDNIEEVDYVWNGEKYSDLTGRNRFYDWIIASHVIEHTPDLIAFLNDCDEVLKEDGVLSLVIPDKRFCFDHFRPVTSLSQTIDAHCQNTSVHTPGTVAEYFLNVVSKRGHIAWGENTEGEYRLLHTLENARQAMDTVKQNSTYLDVHAWCFVPHSFRLMIQDLFDLGLIAFQEVDFRASEGFEFYVTLGRKGEGMGLSRLAALGIIELEVSDETCRKNRLKDKWIHGRVHLLKRILGRLVRQAAGRKPAA